MDIGNNYRTVLGIMDSERFKITNGNECGYINVLFEKFKDGPNSYVYDIANMRNFFSENRKVFITSNADQIQGTFGDTQLLELKATESSKSDEQCKYLVHYLNISKCNDPDVIEIVKAQLPFPDDPVIKLSYRPSTSFIMLETTMYSLSSEDVPFIPHDSVYTEYSEEDMKNCINNLFNNYCTQLSTSSNLMQFDYGSGNNVHNFSIQINKLIVDGLSQSIENAMHDVNSSDQINDVIVSGIKENIVKAFQGVSVDSEIINNIMQTVRTRINLYNELVKYKLVDTQEDPSFQNILNKIFSKIKNKKVLIGPFVCHSDPDLSPDGSILCRISVPDRGKYIVKDECSATTRCVDYSSMEQYIKEVSSAGKERRYIIQMKNWQTNGEKIDFIDEKKLIDKYCKPILGSVFKDLRPSHMTFFENNSKASRNFHRNDARLKKAFQIIETVAKFDGERQKFFTLLSKQPEFYKFMREYMDSHSSEMLKEYEKGKIDEINHESSVLTKERDRLKQEITQLKKNQVKLLDKKTVFVPETENVQKKKEDTVSQEEQNALSSKYKELQEKCGSMKTEIDSLSHTKDVISTELKKEVSDLSGRYLDMHSMLKAFTSVPKIKNMGFSFTSNPVSHVNLDNLDKSRNRYIEELTRIMRGMGRVIDRNKLISMVVTVAQNQFTILAGLPGSGKTSFVKCMGRALNLGQRLHTIPVARGWTSQRDILGYWNSLSGIFQSAPTGLWELLCTLDAEKNPAAVTPSFLLLDEMNLSSPEHYFSSFLDLADGESERRVFTGCPDKSFVNIPDYLRFIGTVNSDDTVNVLSPRMLDRSAVILFEEKPSQSEDNNRPVKTNQEPMNTYSAQDWQTLFQPQTEVPNSIYGILNRIEETLYQENSDLGQRIIISYRKHQQILNFLSVAVPMMNSTETALDFAAREFVLPMVNGYGELFGKRLEALRDVFSSAELVESARIMDRIIAEGEDRMNSYQFLN